MRLVLIGVCVLTPKKPLNIVLVMDDRLSRERSHILTRTLNAMRQEFNFELVSGEITEAQVLSRIQQAPVHLLLVPWYRYLAWTRVEALFAQNRGQGPLFAGYIGEPTSAEELGERTERARLALIDFAHPSTPEILAWVNRMADEKLRSGLRPMLAQPGIVHTENWSAQAGLGLRIDAVLGLPEITRSVDWLKRAPSIRLTLLALWSLIYDEGPGKAGSTPGTAKACFQLTADAGTLAFRLCYSMPGWGPKEAVAAFWADPSRPASAARLLQQHADFVRVHLLGDGPDVEVTVGFHASGASDPRKLATLWIDPISPRLVSEIPFQTPDANTPYLRALNPGAAPATAASAPDDGKLKKFMIEAATRIRDLRRAVVEKDEVIRELRSGGVGTSQPLPPPDAEGLLEAFQARYFEAQLQIRQLEVQIQKAEAAGASPQLLEAIRAKIAELSARERAWIAKIQETIDEAKTRRGG